MGRARRIKIRAVGLLAGAAIAAMVLAGCGAVGGGSSAAGPLKKYDFSSYSYTVGSKDFTEQQILGYIAVTALEAAGANVTPQIPLASTNAARQALVNGEIDMYWEYTGTNWITHLGHTDPIPNAQKQYQAAAKEELKKNNIRLLDPPAPMNNTYALTVRQEVYNKDSKQYDPDLAKVQNLSDIGTLIKNHPDKATLCVESEFQNRNDGLPGMEKKYGYKFPEGNVSRFQTGVVYQRTDKGKPCNFGEVFTSDGRVAALNLKVLDDNKKFFPLYNPTINVKEGVYQKNKKLQPFFKPISQKITLDTMQKLNKKVDIDGSDPQKVAEDWLKSEGLIQ